MLNSRRTQISEELGNIVVNQSPVRFNFYYQTMLHKKIGFIVAQYSAIFIIKRQWELLLDMESRFSQPVDERIFINLFEVSVTMKLMDRKTGFTDQIA